MHVTDINRTLGRSTAVELGDTNDTHVKAIYSKHCHTNPTDEDNLSLQDLQLMSISTAPASSTATAARAFAAFAAFRAWNSAFLLSV